MKRYYPIRPCIFRFFSSCVFKIPIAILHRSSDKSSTHTIPAIESIPISSITSFLVGIHCFVGEQYVKCDSNSRLMRFSRFVDLCYTFTTCFFFFLSYYTMFNCLLNGMDSTRETQHKRQYMYIV